MSNTTLEKILRDEMVRYLVTKAIFCPVTGQVLDERTCVVLNDIDGDPLMVLSPDGWTRIAAKVENQARLLEKGVTVDLNTILPRRN
jgi:hypothetical protein